MEIILSSFFIKFPSGTTKVTEPIIWFFAVLFRIFLNVVVSVRIVLYKPRRNSAQFFNGISNIVMFFIYFSFMSELCSQNKWAIGNGHRIRLNIGLLSLSQNSVKLT